MLFRSAFANHGNLSIGNTIIKGRIGSTVSQSAVVAGDLTDGHRCETGTIWSSGKKLEWQTATSVYEVTLTEERGFVNDITGRIRLNNEIAAPVADRGVSDSLRGTYVWSYRAGECPDNLVRLHRGPLNVYTNSTANFAEALVVLEKKDQAAGLELKESFHLCSHAAYRTHLKDIVVVFHPDNRTSLTTEGFDPSVIADTTRIESEMSFLHIRNKLGEKEKLKQIHMAICETRRDVTISRMEAIAGTDNPYSLQSILGPGHMSTKSGVTVYVTKCEPVSVTPRNHVNCTQEIPVVYNGTDMFVDPFTLNLITHGTIVRCNDVAPPRWLISGKWYCALPKIMECHQPKYLPLADMKLYLTSKDETKGLGRSIYNEQQMTQFF